MKKITLSKAKEKAWKQFSKYIRLKYCTDGEYVECYTCGKFYHWKKIQAGHALAGRGNAVLFQEDIVRPQCVGCNVFQHGRLDEFVLKLSKEIGVERINYLRDLKHSGVIQFKTQDYLDLAEEYKNKIKNLL